MLWIVVTECRLWTRESNRAAANGVFYGWTSLSDCMTACLTSATCVAIDTGPVGCVLHHNASDLMSAYNATGVTHFVLDRHCLHTTPQPTRRATTVDTVSATSTPTSGTVGSFRYSVSYTHLTLPTIYSV